MSMIDTLAVPFAKTFFGQTGRLRIYEQLEALLRGGVKLDKAMEALWDRASKGGKDSTNVDAIVLEQWRQEYRKDAQFAKAISAWVPVKDQMLIEAGEMSGEVADALREVQEVNESISEVKGMLIGALTYPVILLAAIVAMIYIFGVQVIPEFADILPVEEWTGIAATLAKLSTFVQTALWPTLAGFIALCVLIGLSMPRWRGHLRSKFDKLPPWNLYRVFQGVSFLLSLSALLRAGVHLPVAMRRLSENANPYMKERIDAALYHINTGASLGDALSRTGHDWPDSDLVADLRIFSQISGVEAALSRLGKRWVTVAKQKVSKASKTIRMLMMVLFAFVIIWLYYGMFDLYSMIQEAASV